jgi:Nucleotidyl transferase AbiEii toxin, Type IV TA system
MSTVFSPRLDILLGAQRRLWPELAQTPEDFTLYGGTAIALRLGHRHSVDFDFFALASTFEPIILLQRVPYLRDSVVRQSAANTLSVTVDRGDPVQLSFFGGLGLGQVAPVGVAEGPRLKIAALIDLAGMKAAVVTQRAELRDYLDIHALMTEANITLPEMLAAGTIIYGTQFSPLLSLKAIAYHDDAALAELPKNVRHDLIEAVKATDPQRMPALRAVRRYEAKP